MAILVLDPMLQADLESLRRRDCRSDRWEECWNGVIVVPPMPNCEHQELLLDLGSVLREIVKKSDQGRVIPSFNLSDRESGWTTEYRSPDLGVYLHGNPSVDHGTHWQGGPDLLIEILSPGERPFDKHPFYAAVGTREALHIDRDPWALELFRLEQRTLTLVGRSDLRGSAVLSSNTIPVQFRLIAGTDRPRIEILHNGDGRKWTV